MCGSLFEKKSNHFGVGVGVSCKRTGPGEKRRPYLDFWSCTSTNKAMRWDLLGLRVPCLLLLALPQLTKSNLRYALPYLNGLEIETGFDTRDMWHKTEMYQKSDRKKTKTKINMSTSSETMTKSLCLDFCLAETDSLEPSTQGWHELDLNSTSHWSSPCWAWATEYTQRNRHRHRHRHRHTLSLLRTRATASLAAV